MRKQQEEEKNTQVEPRAAGRNLGGPGEHWDRQKTAQLEPGTAGGKPRQVAETTKLRKKKRNKLEAKPN
jgi:hypothetical protein